MIAWVVAECKELVFGGRATHVYVLWWYVFDLMTKTPQTDPVGSAPWQSRQKTERQPQPWQLVPH